MPVASGPTYSPTALDLCLADAFARAAAVAEAWAAAPLNPRVQAAALVYLTALAPEDQQIAEAWASEPGLRDRITALVQEAAR